MNCNFQITEKTKKITIGFIFLALFVVCYHLTFACKFLPPQEGWFQVLANSILDGKLPYKDFHFCLPPLYLYIQAGLIKLFGTNLVVSRIYGCVERILMCGFLYLIFCRFIPIRYALISTITAFLMFGCTPYDLCSSYMQTCTLMSLISLYLVGVYIKLPLISKKKYIILTFIGVLLSVGCLLKQTTGCLLWMGFPFVLLLLESKILKIGPMLKNLFFYLLGSSFVFGAFSMFLVKNGIFELFLNQVFWDNLNSGTKGSLSQILFGFIKIAFSSGEFFIFIIALLLFVYIYRVYKATKESWSTSISDDSTIKIVGFGLILLFLISLAYLTNIQSFIKIKIGYSLLKDVASYTSITYCIVIALSIYYYKKFSIKTNSYQLKYFFLLFPLAVIYMIGVSFSYTLDPNGAIFPLGLVIAYFYYIRPPMVKLKNIIFLRLL